MIEFGALIHGTASVEGGHVSYFYTERLDKPLVLLPGSYSDARQFEAMIAHLPGTQPLIIVENRGHGGSWPPVKHGFINLFARDVVHVIEALGVDKFIVGGHSIGGMIAIEVGRIYPRRVLGIISIEGWTNHKQAKAAYRGISHHDTLTPEQDRARIAERERVVKDWSPEQIKHFASIWKKWSGKGFLERATVPIIEIYGDRGKIAPARAALGIPRNANIDFITIPGGSHYLPLQFPHRLATIIQEFIKRIA